MSLRSKDVVGGIFIWLMLCPPVATLGYCPKGWLKHGRKCYVMIRPPPEGVNAAGASDVCRSHGGVLMNPKTEELANMATVLLSSEGGSDAFVGLIRDEDGDLRWGDGSKAQGIKWRKGDPDYEGDCVDIRPGGEFNDFNCYKLYRYRTMIACEKTTAEQIVVPPTKEKNCNGRRYQPSGLPISEETYVLIFGGFNLNQYRSRGTELW